MHTNLNFVCFHFQPSTQVLGCPKMNSNKNCKEIKRTLIHCNWETLHLSTSHINLHCSRNWRMFRFSVQILKMTTAENNFANSSVKLGQCWNCLLKRKKERNLLKRRNNHTRNVELREQGWLCSRWCLSMYNDSLALRGYGPYVPRLCTWSALWDRFCICVPSGH